MTPNAEVQAMLEEAGWLRGLAASLIGDAARADDLVQDTWIAALKRPPRAVAEPRPWLARVVRNLARNDRRDRARRAVHEELAHEERALPGPDALAQQAEAQRLLADAVTRLAEPLRDAIVLRYFQGLDSSAAAARLGVPASTLRTRLQRALEELRADLDRRHEGGRAGWGLLLAPLAGRAPGATASAPAAAASGAWSPALLATAGALGVLAVGAAFYRELRREPGVTAAALATPSLETSQAEPQEAPGTRRPSGSREPVEAAPASETSGAGATQAPAPARMQLGGEAVLAGTILVDGRLPEWPIELTLDPEVPPVPAGDRMPRQRLRMRRDVITVEPEQQGRFSFGDLAPTWSGRLSVSDFPFANGEFSLAIDAPRPDLVLALHSGPAIFGRILDPAGRPAERLEGGYQFRRGSAGQPATDVLTSAFRCRSDGRFRIQSWDHGYESGSLTLRVEAEGVGYLRLETPFFDPGTVLDLGDLQLEPVRVLGFTVRDANDAPVEGAFARIDGLPWSRRSASTGPDGKGSLSFAPDRVVDVRVSAAGFADRVVQVLEREAVDVVLERLAILDLRLVGSLGVQADRVRLTSSRAAFVWDDGNLDDRDWDERADLQAELGGIKPNERRWPATIGQNFEYEFQRQYDGHFRLVGLVPDVPIAVEVLDAQGSVLATETVFVAREATAKLELGDPSTPGLEPARMKMPLRRSEVAPR